MAGKYAQAAKKYPRADPRDFAFQERVDRAKGAAAARTEDQARERVRVLKLLLASAQRELFAAKGGEAGHDGAAPLAHRYAELRTERAHLDALVAEANVLNAAAEQLMWDAFEAAGLENAKLVGGGSVSVTEDVTISVVDRAALNQWARDNGLESELTLYHPTVESVMKARILAGSSVPECVKVGSIKKTTYRK